MKFFTGEKRKKYSYFIDFCKSYIKIIRVFRKESSSEGVVIDKIFTLNLEEVNEDEVDEFFSKLFASTDDLNLIGFIPRRNTTIKYLKLPSSEKEEIDKMIAFEVEKKIPYEIEEITYDYKIQFVDSEGYAHLMLVIAHKRRVRDLIQNFERYNLVIDSVLLDVEVLCKWYNFEYESNDIPVGVLDVDVDKINFIVVKNGVVDFSRNIPVGSKEFGKKENRYALQKLKDVMGRSVEVYNKNSQRNLSKIIITGAENNLDLIRKNLQSSFPNEFEIRSCFENVSLGFASEKFKKEGTQFLSFTYLVGAALSYGEMEFDFLPSEKKAKKELERKKSVIKKIGILLSFLLIVIMILIGYKFYYLSKKLFILNQKLKNVAPKAKKIEKKVSLIRKLSKYLKDRDYSLDILREIYVRIPDKIHLNHLEFSRGREVILRGEAKKIPHVFSFVSELEESDKFNSVKADRVNVSENTQKNLVNFEIYCDINNDVLKK